MGLVNPSQSNPGETIEAADINTPVNQLAAVINGNIDQNNIAAGGVGATQLADSSVSDAKLQARFGEIISDFVYSGGTVAQTAGLTGSFSDIVYYIGGIRYTKSSVPNKTYTASKDTYVDINGAGTVAYNEVANGAAAPSLTSGYIRVALVVTSGSAITSVQQYGRANSVQIYPIDRVANQFYQELARTTLTSAGDTISVSGFTPRKYLYAIARSIPTGGTTNGFWRFNNDSGNNYAYRVSTDGGADTTLGSTSSIPIGDNGTAATDKAAYLSIDNFPTREKLVTGEVISANTAGAANIPNRRVGVGKWANTTSSITRIDYINSGAGDFAAGSEVIVLGHD